jgi:hypothetical protein
VSLALASVLYGVFTFSQTAINVIMLILLVLLFFLSGILNEVYLKRKRYSKPIMNVSIISLFVIGFFMFGQKVFTPEQFASFAPVPIIAWVILMFFQVITAFYSFILHLWRISKEAKESVAGTLIMMIPWLIAILCVVGYILQSFVQHELLQYALPLCYLTIGLTYIEGGWFLNMVGMPQEK